MGQLAKIGQELMRPEDDRDPMWRSIPVAKEIMVSKGIAIRAPWENIEVSSIIIKLGCFVKKKKYRFSIKRS